MSLQFVIGTGSSDHEAILLEEAQKWLQADPENQVFYLVPNYIKFQQEIHLLSRLRTAESVSTTRLQVFSFSRLAWYYLQHTKYYSGNTLSEPGAMMLLRRCLAEHKEELRVFKGEVNKPGFIKQLYELFIEFKNGLITEAELAASGERLVGKAKDLTFKLQDFQLIFTQLDELLLSYDIKATEILTYLTHYLAHQDLSKVLFVVEGYTRLNAKEEQLIETLMQQGNVAFSMILDRPKELDSFDLFYDTTQLYQRLYQKARTAKVPVRPDRQALVTTDHDLKILDDYWQESRKISPKWHGPKLTEDRVMLWRSETNFHELELVAKEIRRLVSEGYRYRDIQVLTRNLSQYETNILPIFAANEIPVYLDQELAMVHHPLVEFIQSLFAIYNRYYRYHDVMRFLRSELFYPHDLPLTTADFVSARNDYRDQIDLTENAVLAFGFEGSAWTKQEDWHFLLYDFESETPEDQAELAQAANQIRGDIQQLLPVFFQDMEAALTAQQAAARFYQFLRDCQVPQLLLKWRDQALEQGALETARNHEQAWQALMDLLDEYVMIFGESAFDFSAFQEIFNSGLEDLAFGKVPATIDQVQFTSLELARPKQAKVVFAIGLDEQTLPKRIENKTLLSDEERQLLAAELAEGSLLTVSQSMANEPFVAYGVLLAATERLYLSCPLSRDGEQEVKVSTYLLQLAKDLQLEILTKRRLTLNDETPAILATISTYRTLVSDVIQMKEASRLQAEPLPKIWTKLEELLLESPVSALAQRVFSILNEQNIPVSLPQKEAEALYGDHLFASVSRIESFYRCQYQYYARYGLRLKERTIFELSPAATGELFHDAMDQFFKVLIQQDKLLTQLTPAEMETLADEVLQNIFADPRFGILSSSERMNYLRYQLTQTIKRVYWALLKQSQRTGMSTRDTEVTFGVLASQKGLPGLEFDLEHGKLSVRGKIDRVDVLHTSEKDFIGVVDYKSSARSFSLTEAYYGLAMQMLTYLDVALLNAVELTGTQAEPAGSFYLHLQNPVIPFEEGQDLEIEALKKFKLDGLMVADETLMEEIDTTLEPGKTSLLYPLQQLKNGTVKAGSRQEDKFVTKGELDQLLDLNRKNFVDAGNQILSGKIELNPAYQGKERIACRFCPFRSVCEFDVMLKENNYHRIEKIDRTRLFKEDEHETETGE